MAPQKLTKLPDLELFRIFLGRGVLLLELDRERDHHAARVLVDPSLDLHEPLVLLADKVLLGEVDDVDQRPGQKKKTRKKTRKRRRVTSEIGVHAPIHSIKSISSQLTH